MATFSNKLLFQSSRSLDSNYNPLARWASTELTAPLRRLYRKSSNRLVVNTLSDELNNNNNRLSLREAINIANSTSGYTEIFLRPGTYTINISGRNEDANASGDFDIFGNGRLKIYSVGRGATINANGLDRVLDVKSGASLTLDNITITGGSGVFDGGGISNGGSVMLNGSSSINGNKSEYSGGGISNRIDSSLRLNDSSSIYGNETFYGGGIVSTDGSLTVLNAKSSIHDNVAKSSGGGIYNGGTSKLTLNGSSSIYSNTATINGGGISNEPLASVTLNDFSSIHNNKANNGGGVYGSSGLTLNGSSSVYDNSPNDIV